MDRFFVVQFLFFAVWAAALLYYPPLSGVVVPVPSANAPRPPVAPGQALRPPVAPAVRPPGAAAPAAPAGPLAQPVPPSAPPPPATAVPPGATPAPPIAPPGDSGAAHGTAAAPTDGKAGANGEWVEEASYARDVARGSSRPIAMLFTGSDWCIWCKKLHGEVLSQPEFVEFAKQKLVLLKLDFPRALPQDAGRKTANRQLQAQFNVRGFPTVVLTDANGRELGRTGYVEGGPRAFIAELEKSLPR